ncbi:alpha/beta fold hydrolase [Stratiformator vulcanicus]|uniref:Phospholipase YtpA n=1 Tax=Stratiformator vulcanicus TaxID=2527980 RepID=A0A517R206_9PLAN|nr:alpha/beta fold hydrolase [Stratiformator vulcanicus]QDT37916.1 Phospholipase YtpA [Stratiformator vulcanicus]
MTPQQRDDAPFLEGSWKPRPACRSQVEVFEASDGYQFHYRRFEPVESRGTVIFLHGIQSHGGWYTQTATALSMAGWRVLLLDRRGSGLNDVDRGHASSADRLLADLFEFAGSTASHECGSRPALLSVSWGGKIALSAAAARPDLFQAVGLLYPGIRTRLPISTAKQVLLAGADRLGAGRKLIELPLHDSSLFTAEPAARRFLETDPLALHHVSVSFLRAGLELDRLANSAAAALQIPCLLMLAGEDRIVDNAATEELFDAASRHEPKLITYPGARHTLEFEPTRGKVVADLLDWLDTILNAEASQ